MHPIIMIASDKDPAIGKAVSDMEAAGFEVRVLNSNTAKLVDFLGAIAGAEDDADPTDDTPKDDPEAALAPSPDDEPKAAPAPDEEPEDEDDPLAPSKMEALIAGEPVNVEIVPGTGITLHPSTIAVGAKTFYSLNESKFSFWPAAISNEPVTCGVELSFDGTSDVERLTQVTFSEQTANPPVLKIGRDWVNEGRGDSLHNSSAIMKGYHYDKGSVNLEDIRKEEGGGVVALLCQKTVQPQGVRAEGVSLIWLTSHGGGPEVGKEFKIHNDQTLRQMGEVKVIARVQLGKTREDDKVSGASPKNKDIYKQNASIYVYK